MECWHKICGICRTTLTTCLSKFGNWKVDQNNPVIPDSSDEKLSTGLGYWAIDFNIMQHAALNALLKILQPHHPCLPDDSRTLLSTPPTVDFKVYLRRNGWYHHFCSADCIRYLYIKLAIE